MLKLRRWILSFDLQTLPGLALLIRFAPASWKYGKSYKKTLKLIWNNNSGFLDVESYQREKYHELATRFNKTKFSDTFGKVDPAVSAILKTKIMRTADLPANPQDLCSENLDTLEMCSSSGSSGFPKTFYLGIDRGPIETAFVHFAWKSAGFKHSDVRAVFRGLDNLTDNRKDFDWKPLLQELQISPFRMLESNLASIWGEISRRKIKFFQGYPSALEVLAKWVINQEIDLPSRRRISGLLFNSEELHQHQIELFEMAFPNADAVSFYGLSEKTAFAQQDTKDRTVYNFSPIYGVTELLDESGSPVLSPGQTGYLYSTGLLFKGSAFVRYELGDRAELVSPATAENNFVLSVKKIQSRWGETLVMGKNGVNISLAAVNLHAQELTDFSRIQFVQRTPGELEILLVPRPGITSARATLIEKKIQDKAGASLDVRAVLVESINLNSRGKAKLFISLIGKSHEE